MVEGRKTNPSQRTNSECVLLPIGVSDGNSIGIGIKAVNLRIAFVSGAVLQPDLEKEALELRNERRSWPAASLATRAAFRARHRTSRETKFALCLSARYFGFAAIDA